MFLRDDAPNRRARRRAFIGFPQGLAVKLQVSLATGSLKLQGAAAKPLSNGICDGTARPNQRNFWVVSRFNQRRFDLKCAT